MTIVPGNIYKYINAVLIRFLEISVIVPLVALKVFCCYKYLFSFMSVSVGGSIYYYYCNYFSLNKKSM